MSSVADRDAVGSLPDELSVLYQRYGPAAYRLAVRRVHDRDLAADVVQEVFLSLWRARHSFEPERGSIGGFLGTLVQRRAVELLRRRASWPATELLNEQHAETLRDESAGPDQLACDQDQQARVLAAIDRLPPAKRQALRLLCLHGYRAGDVASLLAIPRGTAKTRILTARSQLRAILPRAALE
jgi:RNA polymerase sigma-70 factor (ECF subfamily)